MALSPLKSKSFYHARSVSLPSRLHPIIPHVDEHLRLSGLENMYDPLDDLLLLPHTQQSFPPQSQEKWVEVVLEKYLGLLDICKEGKEGDPKVSKRFEECQNQAHYRRSWQKPGTFGFTNEVEEATIGVLESFLSNISGTKADSRLSAFSLASKLVHRKIVASENEETKSNVFDKFDAALHSLNNHKMSKSNNAVHIENVQHQMEKMESSIQDIEEGLECLFRRLNQNETYPPEHSQPLASNKDKNRSSIFWHQKMSPKIFD
ncbi:uncharacterized protein LOC131327493 [Rhododendron vialii]|uniref:uncharacterized protein LOC131327493 n=1 Tax=Rhododendron vialii TaxID=182163 RepID=UPI00265E7309|nr:uncharacterized protein LOC131327493 [Rhododendron vialii]